MAVDYDGDGKADAAFYRDDLWYIIQNSNSQIGCGNFGVTGDIPISNVYVKWIRSKLKIMKSAAVYF